MVRTLLAEFWASPSVLTLVFVEFEGISHHKVHFFAVLMPSLRVIKGRGILEEHSQTFFFFFFAYAAPSKWISTMIWGLLPLPGQFFRSRGLFFPACLFFSKGYKWIL